MNKGVRLTISHPTPGHQLQHEPVSRVFCPEDHLIDELFFQDIPAVGFRVLEELSQDRGTAGILEWWSDGVLDKIEERGKKRVAQALG